MEHTMTYIYGMRLRPFGIGCQPKDGLLGRVDTIDGEPIAGKYWDAIEYNRPLTFKELRDYDLDLLKASERSMRALTPEEESLLDDYIEDVLTIITREYDYDGRIEYWKLSTPEDDILYFTTEDMMDDIKYDLRERGVIE